jgi:hypothetical protein
MEMIGKLPAPVALTNKKEPLVPIVKEDGWASELFWTLWKRRSFFMVIAHIISALRNVITAALILDPTHL